MLLFETVQSYESLREKLIAEIDSRVEQDHVRKFDDARTLLYASDPVVDHERACERRAHHEDSGRWLLKKTQIKSWKDDAIPDSSILWLNGIPGAGMVPPLY
jgi:hypothetical protein